MKPDPRSPLAALFAAPGKFDFFQAVRLLERVGASNGRAALGSDVAPEREALALKVLQALRFPSGPVAKATATADGPPELTAAFGGLTGPDGILPQHYTALIISRARLKDLTLRDWLDMFHHRLLSLLTRAWEKNQWAAVVDRQRAAARPGDPRAAPKDDPATRGALALSGFGTGGLRERLKLPPDVPVYYAGLLSRQPRTATGLEQILSDYFGWPVQVQQYPGQWLYLDAENKAELPRAARPAGSPADSAGESRGRTGLNCTLGRDVVIGRRVWDVQSSVRVVVGPLDGPGFRSLLPGGHARGPLCALVRLYLGLEFDAEVQVVIAPDAVPVSALEYDERQGPRLGWNTWVRAHNFGAPVGDVTFAVG